MLKIVGVAIAASLSSIVAAAPVYLDCGLADGEKGVKFSVKLDEASGKITQTWADGAAFNAEGFFAANTISYQEIMIAQDIKITMRYEINRNTLAVNRQSNIEALNPEYASLIPPSSEAIKGTCAIVNIGDRKI